MNHIHHTAVIHPDAVIGDDNAIGPYCVIGPLVSIGDSNKFESHVSIGSPAEKHGYFQMGSGPVSIGSDNVVREFVTINGGTTRVTSMGNRCLMLRGSHLSHDSVLEDDVTVSCSVLIGGESRIMQRANLGLGAILHQFSCVGSFAMVGMGCVVTKQSFIKPGYVFVGNPARELKKNQLGLDRWKVTNEELQAETKRWLKLEMKGGAEVLK